VIRLHRRATRTLLALRQSGVSWSACEYCQLAELMKTSCVGCARCE